MEPFGPPYRSKDATMRGTQKYRKEAALLLKEAGIVKPDTRTIGGETVPVLDFYAEGETPDVWYSWYTDVIARDRYTYAVDISPERVLPINCTALGIQMLESWHTSKGVVIPASLGHPAVSSNMQRWLSTVLDDYVAVDEKAMKMYEYMRACYADGQRFAGHFRDPLNSSSFWMDAAFSINGRMRIMEILCLIHGTGLFLESIADEPYLDEDGRITPFGSALRFKEQLEHYAEHSSLSLPEQFQTLLKAYAGIYLTSSSPEDPELAAVLVPAVTCTLPVFVVKHLCERYGVGFWRAWDALEKFDIHPFRIADSRSYEPLQTAGMFAMEDDVILNLQQKDFDTISDATDMNIRRLRRLYIPFIDEPLMDDHEIVELLREADRFYHVQIFAPFLHEALMNRFDRRWNAYWCLLRYILHDTPMFGDTPDEIPVDPKAPWYALPDTLIRHPRRILLKTYFGILANPALRKHTF